MKLLKKAERHVEHVLIEERKNPTFLQWLNGKPGDLIRTRTVTGRMSLSSCVIDFENDAVVLCRKIDMLKFGNVVYRGVIPLIRKNRNVAECVVDYIEEQK